MLVLAEKYAYKPCQSVSQSVSQLFNFSMSLEGQERPGAPRSAQERTGAPRSPQKPPGAPRSAQEPPRRSPQDAQKEPLADSGKKVAPNTSNRGLWWHFWAGGRNLENPAPAPGTPNRPPGHRRAGSFLAAFCRDASCHSYILALSGATFEGMPRAVC